MSWAMYPENFIKKYLMLQILWLAEHRSIFPFLAIFFICVFWPRKGFQAVIFMLSPFRVGLKKKRQTAVKS